MCKIYWKQRTRPARGSRESYSFPRRRTHHQRLGCGIAAGGSSPADRRPRPEFRKTASDQSQTWRGCRTRFAPRSRIGSRADCCGPAAVRARTVETNSRLQTSATFNGGESGCWHSPVDVTFPTRLASEVGKSHAQPGLPQWPRLDRTDICSRVSNRSTQACASSLFACGYGDRDS